MWGIEAHHVFQAITGGSVVLVGVIVADWFHGRRLRKDAAIRASLRAAHLISRVAGGYIDTEVDHSMDGWWWPLRQELWERLGEARVNAHGFRGAKAIRDEVGRVMVNVGAADSVLLIDGKLLPPRAVLDLTSRGLTSSVDPGIGDLKEGFDQVREQWGFERYHDDPNT